MVGGGRRKTKKPRVMKELVVTSDRMVRVGLIEKVVLEQRLEGELTLDCV